MRKKKGKKKVSNYERKDWFMLHGGNCGTLFKKRTKKMFFVIQKDR
jgi:hypothetical protein